MVDGEKYVSRQGWRRFLPTAKAVGFLAAKTMSWSKIGKGSKKDKKELGIKEVEGSYNSLPGHDNPNDSYWGDESQDLLEEAIDKINAVYLKAWGRPVTEKEIFAHVELAAVDSLEDEN